MKAYQSEDIRNVAIVAHGGAGKTTLAEAMLFTAKTTDRLGSVDQGTSVLDYDPEEIKRNITISSAFHHCDWQGKHINIIDTPGYANFIVDTRSCMRIAGGAILIVSAISGVKVQTEAVWKYAEEFELPKLAFISKLDRERANFFRAIDEMENTFKCNTAVLQLPIGIEDSFSGVVDLIKLKAYRYAADQSGSFEVIDIPGEMQDEVMAEREKMIERVVEADDDLIEKYLGGEEITEEDIFAALHEGTQTGKFVPVVCGSALKNIGISQLLDILPVCLPSPVERGEVRGSDPKTGEDLIRQAAADQPFSGLVFKTISDPFTGKLSLFRVYSGTLTSDSTCLNINKQKKERIGQLLMMEGAKQRPIEKCIPGDIVAVAKLKETITWDTLCDEKATIQYAGVEIPAPVISFSLQPKSKGDEEKLTTALHRLQDEDPTIQINRDAQTKELVISGMGQVHVEVTVAKLKRKFGVEVEMKEPKVPYKETIRTSIKVQGKYKKQSGGKGQYGDTWLEISPLPRGGGFEFADNIVGGVVPRQYIPAVEKGILEAMAEGVVAGYPVQDIKVSLYDGSYHSVDSSEMAFKIAGSMGFKKGVKDAKPVLLEPIMEMEITAPNDYMGDIIGDLNSRRGKVNGVEPMANSQLIKASVPMAEVLKYAPDLRSLTGGRGMFTMEFSHYEEVPAHLAEKIIQEAAAERENG
ncbi:MAG: elongation factor G [Deltaproteobacteria bacterium]|nr:elongation factor G [Candidatus Anaeroferrophillus wilburensis]MBN2888135.1 elongation factor G [Deltaproteobacteria bacterium]